MPAESQAQRAYLNAKFGHDWVRQHHFDNAGKLPEHVKKPGKKKMSAKSLAQAAMKKAGKGLRV
jgi:hypothetical protein